MRGSSLILLNWLLLLTIAYSYGNTVRKQVNNHNNRDHEETAKEKKDSRSGSKSDKWSDPDQDVLIDNSCIGKEDGLNWLKFSDLDEDYVPVYLSCSNEYAILDYSQDSNLENYFSSWQLWHYGTAGPKDSDTVTWNEWFLGNRESLNGNYLVSPDCSVCDESSSRQLADLQSTYWMSGNLAKHFWWNFALPGCDMDYDTYECYSCQDCMDVTLACDAPSMNDATSSDDFDMTGICTTAIRDSSSVVAKFWKDGANGMGGTSVIYKPSLGIDSRFCVCYKPNEDDFYQFTATQHDIEVMHETEEKNKEETEIETEAEKLEEDVTDQEAGEEQEEQDEKDNIFYLGQKDFENGPLRIMNSGTYIFTEDVVFDFGADNDYPYYPDISQSDDYPGAGEYRGAWCMGFFAAITVETDDVIIDLGGYELKQSIEYYFQHRFFTHIELSSTQFLPGQGPAFFGEDPVFINNFELRNGILGRSSHFGIHGNYPSNVVIKNIQIRDFATHGIQLNGWENIEMDNVEIGPSSNEEWLLGDYAHARLMVPRIKALIDELNSHSPNGDDGGEEIISLPDRYNNNERGVTVQQVLDNLEYEMSLAYDYAMNRHYERYSDNDYISPDLIEDAKNDLHWKYAKEQFIWENGLPSATSIHGIFLNTHSVSVATFTFSSAKASHGAKLNNVRIHDLHHSYREIVRLAGDVPIDGPGITPWNTVWDGRGAFGGDDNLMEYYNIMVKNYENKDEDDFESDESWKDFDYVGNVLTDSYMTLYYFSNSWDYTGFLVMETSLYNFVLGLDDYGDDEEKPFNFGCNMDVMTHSGKGLLALRMDAVYDVEISNIYIYNLYEETPLGAIWCGEYEGNALEKSDGSPGSGGHFRQVTPQQTGFSGNNLQGISITGSYNIKFSNDIIISNLKTDYGEITGFSVWPNSDVTIAQGSNMIVSNFESGILLTDDIIDEYDMTWYSRPNRLPESCGIRLENKDPDDYSASTMEDSVLTFENGIENSNVITCGMTGHAYCLGDETNGNTLYGDEYDESDVCEKLISNAGINGGVYDKVELIDMDNTGLDDIGTSIIGIIVVGAMIGCLLMRKYVINEELSDIPQKELRTRYGSTIDS